MNRLITTVIAYIACQSIALAASVVDIAVAPQTDSRSHLDVVITFQGAFEDVANCRCDFVATNGVTHTEIPVSHINQIGPDEGTDLSWTRRFVWEAEKDIGPVRIDELELTANIREKIASAQLWEDGPYWAECNVGAAKPEEYGYYFWWGDTVGYKRNESNNGWVSASNGVSFSFSTSNCPTYNKTTSQLRSKGYIDSTGSLTQSHDAVTAHLGAPWRMPTDAEFAALLKNCDTIRTTRNGVNGLLVKGRGAYASNSIFLPASGYSYGGQLFSPTAYGGYWSSTPYSETDSYFLRFEGYNISLGYYMYYGRSCGLPVRPVRECADIVTPGENIASVSFAYDGRIVENPVITPESGTTFDSSLSVSMSCASEGATIHYTTDGSEPTMESPVFKRFRVSGKTTVKARAFYENGSASEIVTAEYALGRCPEPVVVSAGGETFYHSGNVVTIEAARESASSTVAPDQVVRYTVDGAEPTAESPIYTEPFTIDASTIVKAKAFSDSFFDSAVVSAELTREWEMVSMPVITAADSFSGSKTTVSIACATDGALIRYTTDGSEPNSHSKRYSGPFEVTTSTVVKAYAVLADYTNSDVAVKTITKVWCIGDSLGLPDQVFTTEGATCWVDDNGSAMKSGAITHNQQSILKTTFVGKGNLAFELKLVCEEDDPDYIEYDHYELWIDGELVVKLDGEHDWEAYDYDLGDGSHAVEWRYVKDEQDDQSTPEDDGIWIRNVVWTPAPTVAETQTTEVPVPFAWLKAKYPELTDAASMEAKATEIAANGVNTVWECYVTGLEPTDAEAKFEATIEMADGVPKVTWSPDLGVERDYKILGSRNLKIWTEVTDETKSSYNFFKVKVEMK